MEFLMILKFLHAKLFSEAEAGMNNFFTDIFIVCVFSFKFGITFY